jgi:PAS domain S-box-containing protein
MLGVTMRIPPAPIRRHLLRLVLVTLLPVVILAFGLGYVLWREQRDTVERGLLATARAHAFAVQRKLDDTRAALQGLATSEHLDRGDLRAFYDEAARVKRGNPAWSTVILLDPAGRQLINLLRPLGERLPSLADIEVTHRLLATEMPTVSALERAPLSGRFSTGVGVVARRGGATRFLVIAAIEQSAWAELLTSQDMPADRVATIVDQRGVVVATTDKSGQFVGKPATDALRRRSALAAEGVLRQRTADGARVYVAWSAIPLAGWRFALGVPARVVEGPPARNLVQAGILALITFAAAVGFALLLGRRIAVPIVALSRSAEALGAGGRPEALPATTVAEVQTLAQVLERAEHRLRERESEREDLLERERAARAQAEAAAEATSRLAAIVESSDDAIIGKTLDGIVTSWNAGAERMFGLTRAEAVGASITRIIPPDRLDEEADVLARIAGGERIDHYDTVRLRRDGSTIQVSVTISPLRDAGGRIVGASKIARDITDRKRIEEERLALLARAEAARTDAEQASRAKDEFLSTVSHELRTPLTAILGWTRMLQSGLDEPTTRRAIDVIARNAQAQTQLIEDLLDIGRITSGKLRLDIRAVDLRDVITAALDAVRPAAEAKEIRLQPALDPRAGPISGDPGRLQQVVWNLLTNAIKFTPRHGRVQVRLERVASHVEIVVSDTGTGIGADVLPHVFEMFRQAEGGSTRGSSGLGLGLALVKQLVEHHGGTVQALSAGLGRGATFRVMLPLMVHVEPASAEREHPTAPTGAAPRAGITISGVRVLVVDDDRDAVEVIERVLAGHGAEVRTARSAAEAFEVLAAWKPNVVLSDIDMPGEDGYGFIERLRALPREQGGAIPAVAVTAYGRAQDRVRALTSGFESHVPKPVEPAELVAVVATLARALGR